MDTNDLLLNDSGIDVLDLQHQPSPNLTPNKGTAQTMTTTTTTTESAAQATSILASSAKNKKLFPQKLWDIINDDKYNFCLRWSDDGQLVYLNRDEFEDSYLKTRENQFHTQKAISFVRQMNMYGFRKVDDCYYENDNFKKNCSHLLKNMIRKRPHKNHNHSDIIPFTMNDDLNTDTSMSNGQSNLFIYSDPEELIKALVAQQHIQQHQQQQHEQQHLQQQQIYLQQHLQQIQFLLQQLNTHIPKDLTMNQEKSSFHLNNPMENYDINRLTNLQQLYQHVFSQQQQPSSFSPLDLKSCGSKPSRF